MAAYLKFTFIDAAEVIFFDEDGNFDPYKTDKVMSARLEKEEYAVIPGFYGAMPDGTVHTFPGEVPILRAPLWQRLFMRRFMKTGLMFRAS